MSTQTTIPAVTAGATIEQLETAIALYESGEAILPGLDATRPPRAANNSAEWQNALGRLIGHWSPINLANFGHVETGRKLSGLYAREEHSEVKSLDLPEHVGLITACGNNAFMLSKIDTRTPVADQDNFAVQYRPRTTPLQSVALITTVSLEIDPFRCYEAGYQIPLNKTFVSSDIIEFDQGLAEIFYSPL